MGAQAERWRQSHQQDVLCDAECRQVSPQATTAACAWSNDLQKVNVARFIK